MSRAIPPRWAEALLATAARGLVAEDAVVGDLAEGYRRRAERRGPGGATVWYLGQALSVIVHRVRERLSGRTAPGGGDGGMEPFRREMGWMFRGMARRPWFGLGVVSILVLAVSATSAAVSLLGGTYRAASWWRDGERTVALWPGQGMSLGQLLSLRQEAQVLGDIGAWIPGTASLQDDEGGAWSVSAAWLSPSLFGALTIQPSLGRGLTPEDEEGMEPVVVLGHDLWRVRFGADPDVVGRTLLVDGVRRRVVGVQGPGGAAPGVGTQLWIPIVLDVMDPDFWPRQDYALVARLPAGTTVEEAQTDLVRVLQILAGRFSFFYPADYGLDATAASANEPVWQPLRAPLLLLLGGSCLLLFVAAINLGNLFLGRALERGPELRVRSVLGATRGRLIGQLLMEGFCWTLFGVGLGLGAGLLLARTLAAVFPVGSQVVSLGFGVEMAAFAAATALLVWMLMSGVPIAHFLHATRAALAPTRFRRNRAQGALVVSQAAMATVLLIGAGLLLRSVYNLGRIPVGFDGAGVVALQVALPDRAYDTSRAMAFWDDLGSSTREVPEAQAFGLVSTLPLRDPVPAAPINREDTPSEVAPAPRAYRHVVDAGLFDALGMRVVAGRGIEETDRDGTEPVVVVNEAMARALWPGQDAVGRRIAVDPHAWDRFLTVVGVVADARFRDLTFPVQPAFYLPLPQAPETEMYAVARGANGRGPVADAVRNLVAARDPGVPVGPTWNVDRVVADAYGASRILMALLAVLALLATALGAVGLYGALASNVTRNRVEWSTRLALGAQPGRVFGEVVRTGLGLTALGIALGSAGAAAGARLMGDFLVGVSPWDPASFLATAAILAVVGAGAAAVPALRAALIAPAQVLREG